MNEVRKRGYNQRVKKNRNERKHMLCLYLAQ